MASQRRSLLRLGSDIERAMDVDMKFVRGFISGSIFGDAGWLCAEVRLDTARTENRRM